MKRKPNKIVKPFMTTIIIIGILFILLHISPEMSLRTHVFATGHPLIAISSDIVDYEFDHSDEKEKFDALHAKVFTMTTPPIDGGLLYDWRVNKLGFVYFADYYPGEI